MATLKHYNSNIIGYTYNVLDHGSIEVVDVMGTEVDVVKAARVSTGKGLTTDAKDLKLLQFLYHRGHTSPFEHQHITLKIKCPLFVARQWMRHRWGSFNEISARYSKLGKEFYVPEHIVKQSPTLKHSTVDEFDLDEKLTIQEVIKKYSECAYDAHDRLISSGLAHEIARLILPVNIYTEFIWTVDLHNFMHFIQLRIDPTAQFEIRQYAHKLLDLLEEWTPNVHQLFIEKHILPHD